MFAFNAFDRRLLGMNPMPARRSSWNAAPLVGLLTLAGCPSTVLPNLLHPGPVAFQQDQAEKALSTTETPNEALQGNGILPPGYTPRAEVLQSRNVRPNLQFQPTMANYGISGPPPSRPSWFAPTTAPPPTTAGQPLPSFY